MATTESPYSSVNDLLLGDLTVAASVDKQKYVVDAGDEIDSRIGLLYVLPLDDLAPASKSLLKRINNNLATGRLIMAVAAGGEDSSIQKYADRLVTDAYNELGLIMKDALPLVGPERAAASRGDVGPTYSNHDEFSAVDAFEVFAHQPFLPGFPPKRWNPWWQAGP